MKAGMYASGYLGVSNFEDSNNQGAVLSVENEFDTGYALAGAVGYDYGNGFRLEGELSYRQADIDKFTTISAGGTSVSLGNGLAGSGDLGVFGLLANGAYDFDIGSDFRPYLMGGFGIAKVSVNDAKVLGVDLADDDDTVFAYQIGVGVNYAFYDGMAIDVGYRYFGTADPTLTDASGGEFDGEVSTHNFMIGMRFAL